MLIGNRGTTGSPMRIAPTLPDDLRMPGQHRRRGHHQGRPPAVGEEPSGKGEKCPISPGEPGTWRTSLEDLELVAEHNDLGILLDAVETMDPKNLEGSTDQTAEKREGHSRKGLPQASDLVKLAFGYLRPTRSTRPSRVLPPEAASCSSAARQAPSGWRSCGQPKEVARTPLPPRRPRTPHRSWQSAVRSLSSGGRALRGPGSTQSGRRLRPRDRAPRPRSRASCTSGPCR